MVHILVVFSIIIYQSTGNIIICFLVSLLVAGYTIKLKKRFTQNLNYNSLNF